MSDNQDQSQNHQNQSDQQNQSNGQVSPVQVQKFLGGMDYPANKQDLIDYAGRKGGDKNVMDTLEKLPDQEFDTPADVSQAIGDIE